MGDNLILVFDFGAEAVDELVDGMIRDAGFVFNIRIDGFTNLVFGHKLAGMGC